MGVILNENFDSLTPPAIPAGWEYTNASYFETVTDPVCSGANALRVRHSAFVITARTPSMVGADAQISGCARITNATAGMIVSLRDAGMFTTGYHVRAVPSVGFVLNRRSGTTNFQLAAVGSAGTFAINTWYRLTLRTEGSTISAKTKRLSDNQWLQPDGSWGASEAWALQATNTVVTGDGYATVTAFGPASNSTYWDNVLIEDTVATGGGLLLVRRRLLA